MTAFIWTIIVMLTIGVITRIGFIAAGTIPERTPGCLVFDIALRMPIILWGIYLAAQNAAPA